MPERIPVAGVWTIAGSSYAEGEIVAPDPAATPDMLADLVDAVHPGISLCHQCAYELSDPEPVELVSFTIGGRTYDRGSATGTWAVSDGR